MARITWQNVAAPDLQDSSRSQMIAARLIGDAVSSFGKGISGLDYRARNKESAAAMNQAMSIRDVEDWDQTLQNGGLMALGISPDRATPELMEFIAGYRKQLGGNRASDLQNKVGEYNFARGIEEDGQADWRFEREQKKAATADANSALDKSAQELAAAVIDGTLSKDEGRQRILSQTQGSPQLRAAALEYFNAGSGDGYSSLDNITYQDQTQADFTVIENGLAREENNLNLAYGGSEALRILDQSIDRFGSGDPLKQLTEYATNAVQKEGLENEDEAINESRGSVRYAFNKLRERYPDLSPEIIASVVEQSWQDDGWLLVGDKEKIDLTNAQEILDQLNTEESRNVLFTQGEDIRNRRKSIEKLRTDAARIQERLNIAISRGDEDAANKERANLRKLVEGFNPSSAAPGSRTEGGNAPGMTNAPANLDAVLEQAVSGIGAPELSGSSDSSSNREQSEAAQKAFREIAGEVASVPGRGLSQAASLATMGVSGLNRATAPWASIINPSWGESLLNSADDLSNQAQTLFNGDVFQLAADGFRQQAQDRRTQDSANPERQIQTPQNVAQGLRAMVAAGDIDPATAIRAEALMTAIQTKKDPFSGRDLSDREVAVMEQLLQRIMAPK